MLRICTTIELSQCRFFKGAFWDKRDPVEWLAEIRASLLYKDRLINFFSPVNCDGGGQSEAIFCLEERALGWTNHVCHWPSSPWKLMYRKGVYLIWNSAPACRHPTHLGVFLNQHNQINSGDPRFKMWTLAPNIIIKFVNKSNMTGRENRCPQTHSQTNRQAKK
jgi:hypothetical protein